MQCVTKIQKICKVFKICDLKCAMQNMHSSNSLNFSKPAWQRPGTLLTGYKLKGVIHRLSPSNVATMLLRPMAPPRSSGAAWGQDSGNCSFFSLALLAQLCSFLVEEDINLAPQLSQLSLQVQLVIQCCTVAQFTLFPSAVPAFVPLHFEVRIFLLRLQQDDLIHALLSHDTSGSCHLF
jgi:hypothetical protein